MRDVSGTRIGRALLAAVFAVGALPSLAGEGRRPIHQPTDIIEPGYYYLTRDVTANGLPAINVSLGPDGAAVIDLNCHTITQTNSAVPVINVSSGKSVTVKNGGLVGGSRAIDTSLSTAEILYLEALEARNQEITAMGMGSLRELIAKDVTVKDSNGSAFELINFSTQKTTGRMVDIMIKNVAAKAIEAIGLGSFRFRNIAIDGSGSGLEVKESDNVIVDGLQTRGTVGPGLTAQNVFGIQLLRFMMVGAGLPATMHFDVAFPVVVSDGAIRGGAGAGMMMESVRAGSIDNVVVDSPAGNVITTDANSSGLRFSNITARNGGAKGVEHAGDDSVFDSINIFRMPSDCLVFFSSTAERNHMTRVVGRGTTSCSCSGVGTTHFCDEGPDNTSQGDNQIPTPY